MEIKIIKNTEQLIEIAPSCSKVRYNPFKDDGKFDYRTWFRKNCTGNVFISASFMYFASEQDATVFRLRFPL